MCKNSEGSGETAQMRRLAWAFAGRLCDKYHNLMSRSLPFYLVYHVLSYSQYTYWLSGGLTDFTIQLACVEGGEGHSQTTKH